MLVYLTTYKDKKCKLEGCYWVIHHSKLATPNASATVPQKWVKGDLRIFHQNVARFWK